MKILNRKIMNRKITFSSFCFVLLTCSFLNAQQIYTNGGMSTGATSASGVAAPSGYTWSELQSETGNTTESNTNFGYSSYYTTDGATSFALADDFIVPSGETWNVTGFDFFCYQTGYTGTTPPIDQLRIQVYSGDPSAGGTLVAGNLTTNVYDAANSADGLLYRTANSVTPSPGTAPGTTRKIWRLRGNITASLTSGTYWVVYQVHATNNGAVFFPPVTVSGTRGLPTWNAKQLTVPTSTWSTVVDSGNPATAPDFNQDMPFLVNGTTVLSNKVYTLDASISFAPNPVKNNILLNTTSDIVFSNVAILDLNGKTIKEFKVIDNNKLEFNVSDLSTGTYILNLSTDKGISTKKFIKE